MRRKKIEEVTLITNKRGRQKKEVSEPVKPKKEKKIRRTNVEIANDMGIPIWHGRRVKYNTAIQLEKQIDEYFVNAPTHFVKGHDGSKVEKKLYTLRGLMLYCGLDEFEFEEMYKQEKFQKVLSRAKMAIGMTYEELLHGANPTGAKFALENLGWSSGKKDTTTVNINPLIQIMQNYGKKVAGIAIEDAQIVETKALTDGEEDN